jgi:hypothetical protein
MTGWKMSGHVWFINRALRLTKSYIGLHIKIGIWPIDDQLMTDCCIINMPSIGCITDWCLSEIRLMQPANNQPYNSNRTQIGYIPDWWHIDDDLSNSTNLFSTRPSIGHTPGWWLIGIWWPICNWLWPIAQIGFQSGINQLPIGHMTDGLPIYHYSTCENNTFLHDELKFYLCVYIYV